MKSYKGDIDTERMPQHVAIIMDGNGRWAKSRGEQRTFGHKNAIDAVRNAINACNEVHIPYLTLYTFSSENWNRPADEVSALMGLVLSSLEDEIFMKNNVRFRVIGDIKRLPQDVQDKLDETMEHTINNDAMTMVVALSYSSRWEITKAVHDIVDEAIEKSVVGQLDHKTVEKMITEETISKHLETSFMPDPDLLIRTGGELRISNYLLWQIAYSELYFCETYWPDFGEEDLQDAILSYQSRQRRFGKTEEQVESAQSDK